MMLYACLWWTSSRFASAGTVQHERQWPSKDQSTAKPWLWSGRETIHSGRICSRLFPVGFSIDFYSYKQIKSGWTNCKVFVKCRLIFTPFNNFANTNESCYCGWQEFTYCFYKNLGFVPKDVSRNEISCFVFHYFFSVEFWKLLLVEALMRGRSRLTAPSHPYIMMRFLISQSASSAVCDSGRQERQVVVNEPWPDQATPVEETGKQPRHGARVGRHLHGYPFVRIRLYTVLLEVGSVAFFVRQVSQNHKPLVITCFSAAVICKI